MNREKLISLIIQVGTPSLVISLVGIYFTWQHNAQQLEITKRKNISEIIYKFVDEEMDTQKSKVNSLSASLFKKDHVKRIITFLEDDDYVIRKSAAATLEMIGADSKKPLARFILNKDIPARFKGEVLPVLKRIDKDEFNKIKLKFVEKMLINHKTKNDIDYENDPFTSVNIVLELFRLDKGCLKNSYLPKIDLSFNERDLRGIDLSGSYLKGANLQGSNLTGSAFNSSNLENANLRSADITNTSFRNAYLEDSVFAQTTGFKKENFEGATGTAHLDVYLKPD